MDAPIAVVMAAGKGTRMKSELPKVLCEANGRPLVSYVLDSLKGAGVAGMVVVVGYKADLVEAELGGDSTIQFAHQTEVLKPIEALSVNTVEHLADVEKAMKELSM